MYNFDTINNRRNTNSLKWDVADNELPMWVADMDFQTAPEIREAVMARAEKGVFGYSIVPDSWYDAISAWWRKKHNFEINREWLIFCTGVIPAVSCAVKRIANVGDNVVVQPPVYNIFYNSIVNHGRHVLENNLIYDGREYHMDMEDLEKKLSHPLTTMMILCNPQNPGGRIWSRDELAKIGELCEKYNVTVLSDEIHCDLTMPSYEYTPYASVSECCRNNSITCIAASKAFNLAGLQSAAVVIPNERIRNIMERGLNSDEVAEPNVFAIDGTVAAFTGGDEWLMQLREYICDNKRIVEEYIDREIDCLSIADSHATYLLWIDCRKITDDSEELAAFIRKNTGLYLSDGKEYHGDGKYFLRMNVACPHSVVEDGLERLKKGVADYITSKNQ